jgi:hypothetical protein
MASMTRWQQYPRRHLVCRQRGRWPSDALLTEAETGTDASLSYRDLVVVGR